MPLDQVAFKTRARTIDHLGREQIADCPTAISELWKNSYDAYASEVALHIYDGAVPIAALIDDGHGMSKTEFIEKWLVVGTESKASGTESPERDKKGLRTRQKQGQKGIGRLSSAALGPLLLLISKRQDQQFVAALIDWRLFENPFLYLQDIVIPVINFDERNQLFEFLPELFDTLMGNIWGSGEDVARDARISDAWARFDALNLAEGRANVRNGIENVIINAAFTERHIEQWPVWSGSNSSGTALLIGDIVFDLEVQIPKQVESADKQAAQQAIDRLFQTLSNFTDPFVSLDEIGSDYAAPDFAYSVTAWDGGLSRTIISFDRSFSYQNLEELEHVVEGVVDSDGVFTGRIKAFGNWLEGEIKLPPSSSVPKRADTQVGPFQLRLGTFEQVAINSSHNAEIHAKLIEQASRYAGFMVFRNGLRVMPYGREDNDFFEIEKRRGQHAGREFWSYRRIFGRVAITREVNRNLKDKAGREGLIDNKAAKVFRDLVENILMTTARRYFGSDSPVRKEVLPEVNAVREKERADADQKKLRARKRREFRQNLKRFLAPMVELKDELEEIGEVIRSNNLPLTEEELITQLDRVGQLKVKRAELSLGTAPANLGTFEEDFRFYKTSSTRANELISQISDSLIKALAIARPKSQRDVVYSELSRNAAYLQNRLRKWAVEGKQLLSTEMARISSLVDERNKRYHLLTLPLLDDLEHGRLSVSQVLRRLDEEKDREEKENIETFESYLSTLRSLEESVDLENIVNVSLAEREDVKQQIDRLNALAQLGITVEIVGHEIESFDMTISRGLREMPDDVKKGNAFRSVRAAHEGLSERLRFLSPLKLSGEKSYTWITGQEIFDYIKIFLGPSLQAQKINLVPSADFLQFSVYELKGRVLPVFINLVNNSIYWAGQNSNNAPQVLLDFDGKDVIVADNGPGVELEDVSRLFSLFFTKKVRGGRGVGLYLCRANLAAGGHVISYADSPGKKRLSGANFVISFKGVK